ncbi:Apoptosis-resistant E3 ubiquitin protein ligase 1 [Acropora cervicornis]|uniref:HECT-type E3 ubiquitin transferase n=1 Tax=Acropora cervicornis TaxID=6130 RepID=A0AAD9PXD6_ACRCE|nr:Apoptosis-resistant E3 ubiquitin protein ligase 1 [Acropora cervicornis]
MLGKIAVYTIGLALIFYRVQVYLTSRQEKLDLHVFLEENELLEYEAKLHKFGIHSKAIFARLDARKFLAQYSSFWEFFRFNSEKERLELASQKAEQEVLLLSHLQKLRIDTKYFRKLLSHGINSVEQFQENLDSVVLRKIFEYDDLLKLQDAAPRKDEQFTDSFPVRSALTIFSFSWWTFKFACKMIFIILSFVLSIVFAWGGISHLQKKSRQSQTSILKYMFGSTMEPKFTLVTWEKTDPYVVGESMIFFIHFYRVNLFPYPVSPDDPILIEIMHNDTLVASSREYGGENWGRSNTMKVSFTVREAGTYRISILARGMPIRGSPFKKDFLPGTIDPSKCVILEGGSLLEVRKNVYTPLTVEARDKFGNICPLSLQDVKSYTVEVTEIGSSVKVDPELVIFPDDDGKNNVLCIKLDWEGCFNAVVKYNGVPVSQGQFTVISLNSEEAKQVDENIEKQCWNVWYEAYLLRHAESSQTNGPSPSSSTPPWMMIQPLIKFDNMTFNGGASKKTSRVYCYISRKIILHPLDLNMEHPTFTVDDGYQSPVTIMCKERNVLVATFSRLLLSKIGGSESFNDKKDFFYRELVAHLGRKGGESYQATVRTLYSSDWLRLFTIKFKDELVNSRHQNQCISLQGIKNSHFLLGVDWGGLRREWVELLCKALFSHESGFFTRFNEDDPQALYFESDDKDLYRSKIKYIEETDPEDLELVFAEEEYDRHGRLQKTVDLKPGGRHIPVTESNKMEYLDLLAQYRLSSSCKQEIEAFAKGLNEFVPEHLLSVFDEYELESLDWFWTIVTSFTQDELARLVQFITGSSQLPPGGFAELSPQIQISSAPTTDALPSAHTCFNQLCLPSYSSFTEMQKKLVLAINEGSEGFSMV